MKLFEYKTIISSIPPNAFENDEKLNKEGLEGWEVYAIDQSDKYCIKFLAKRELTNTKNNES